MRLACSASAFRLAVQLQFSARTKPPSAPTCSSLPEEGLEGTIPEGGWALPKTLKASCVGYQLDSASTFELEHVSPTPIHADIMTFLEQVLNLTGNAISGTLSAGNWTGLPAVEVLDLSSNNISGPIPADWSVGLQVFHLNMCVGLGVLAKLMQGRASRHLLAAKLIPAVRCYSLPSRCA